MKKIISFLIAISFVVPSLAFAQTPTNLQTVYTSALQQLISLLVQEVTQLEQQLAALNAKQDILQSEISSSTVTQTTSTPTSTYTPSPTLNQLQQTAPQVVQTSSRAFTVQEEAKVNLGQGFMRGPDFGSDMPNHQPTTTPGELIAGELVFTCFYNSHVDGEPDFCTVPTDSTSSFPQIASAQLTVKFDENSYLCKNGTLTGTPSEGTETVSTDANGNFSFTAPGDASLQDYQINIYNGSQAVFWLNVHNATATSTPEACSSQ